MREGIKVRRTEVGVIKVFDIEEITFKLEVKHPLLERYEEADLCGSTEICDEVSQLLKLNIPLLNDYELYDWVLGNNTKGEKYSIVTLSYEKKGGAR